MKVILSKELENIQEVFPKMKEIKTTNREVITMWNTINHLQDMGLMGAKYKYWLSINKKNIETVKSSIEEISKEMPPVEGFKAFSDHRIQLCKEIELIEGQKILHKEILPNGNETYKIDNNEKFEEQLAPLKEEYADAIEANSKREKEINDLLDQEVEVKMFVLNVDNLPDEVPEFAVDVLINAIES